ncbi:MAG TPA: hypothetical protein VK832_00780 [Burkholderiaceae bacterium]|nr:hypothetical protein [Burkholderiaceae bacterium]
MKIFTLCAFLFVGTSLTLLAGCASSTTPPALASNSAQSCVVTEPKLGSNMSHRECSPAPVAGASAPKAAAPSTPVEN